LKISSSNRVANRIVRAVAEKYSIVFAIDLNDLVDARRISLAVKKRENIDRL